MIGHPIDKYNGFIIKLICKKGEEIVYDDKLYLTPKDMLEKKFKINARGYDPEEVDRYLDMAIRDYNCFIKNSKMQRQEIQNLTEDNAKLKKEIRALEDELEALKHSSQNRAVPNNVDLMRRVSNLEKVVFGKEEE